MFADTRGLTENWLGHDYPRVIERLIPRARSPRNVSPKLSSARDEPDLARSELH